MRSCIQGKTLGNTENIKKALLDGVINAVAIFFLTMGGLMLAGEITNLKPAFLTATAVAFIRFSLRLYQEDGVSTGELSELPMVPDLDSDKSLWRQIRFTNVCRVV